MKLADRRVELAPDFLSQDSFDNGGEPIPINLLSFKIGFTFRIQLKAANHERGNTQAFTDGNQSLYVVILDSQIVLLRDGFSDIMKACPLVNRAFVIEVPIFRYPI